jgi:hypothetical protein
MVFMASWVPSFEPEISIMLGAGILAFGIIVLSTTF